MLEEGGRAYTGGQLNMINPFSGPLNLHADAEGTLINFYRPRQGNNVDDQIVAAKLVVKQKGQNMGSGHKLEFVTTDPEALDKVVTGNHGPKTLDKMMFSMDLSNKSNTGNLSNKLCSRVQALLLHSKNQLGA
jgi:hypothetical protein